MQATHETSGSMAIELSPDDIAHLRAREAVEAEPTESGLVPFVVMENHEFRGLAEAKLFDNILAIYIHQGFFAFGALKEAIDEQGPIVEIPRNRIGTTYESPTNARVLFGSEGTITLQPPQRPA